MIRTRAFKRRRGTIFQKWDRWGLCASARASRKASELGSARMPRPPLAHRPPCSIFAASIDRPSAKQGSFFRNGAQVVEKSRARFTPFLGTRFDFIEKSVGFAVADRCVTTPPRGHPGRFLITLKLLCNLLVFAWWKGAPNASQRRHHASFRLVFVRRSFAWGPSARCGSRPRSKASKELLVDRRHGNIVR